MTRSRYYLLAAAFAAVLFVALSAVGPAWNRSDSLPRGLYLATKASNPSLSRSQIACFPYEQPVWTKVHYLYPGEIICKHVLGVPGDTVSTTNNETFVCHEGHCENVGKVLAFDGHHRPIQHVSYNLTVIPEGMYYMGATRRPNSLDSRYLGLVPKNKIVKTLIPILVEQDN
jgi:conjugative transfer signal peptidase TraF